MQKAASFVRRLSAGIHLEEADREALAGLGARKAAVPAGHDLIVEGEAVRHGLIFERGWGCRYALLEDGRRQILQLLVAGDHAGESGAIFGEADHSIATLTPAHLLLFPAGALTRLATRHPRLHLALEWSRLRERAIIQARLVGLGRRSACQSMAHLILELFHRLHLVGQAGKDDFALPLTQETLADTLGLTMVHVNRTLRQLRAEGLIDLDNGLLTILDRDRLTGLAGFDPSYLHHIPVSRAAADRVPAGASSTASARRADRAV